MIWMWLGMWASFLMGWQEDAPGGNAPPGSSATPSAASQPKESPEDLAAEGEETITLRKTPLLEELLKELERREAGGPVVPPAASVSNLQLSGSADQDKAELTARIQIEILRSDRWVQLPLQFGEAQLRDTQYDGPGSEVGGIHDPKLGYQWWFRGQGQHVLTLKMVVPLRKELPVRRLQLSLPTTAISELRLTVPHEKITAKADERSRMNVAPEGMQSRIDVLGLGARLDLQWQPVLELPLGVPAVEARESCTVTLDGENLLFETNQRILALQGSISTIQVRLPRGGEVLKLESTNFNDYQIDPQNPDFVRVNFKEPLTNGGFADLKWTVRAGLPANPEQVRIEGFDVTDAKIQTGYLGVRVIGDFRVNRLPQQDQFIQRDNVSSLSKVLPAMPNTEGVTSAYRILRQPFQLNLSLQKQTPLVTVTPHIFLQLSGERAELNGVFDFQVYRGGIEELTFQWPGWSAAGWRIEPFEPASRVEQTILDDPDQPDQIRVRLIERTTGPFQLSFRATRPFTAGKPAEAMPLPSANVSTEAVTDLVVALADNLEADVRPSADQVAAFQPTTWVETVPLPTGWRDLRRTAYRVDVARPVLNVATVIQKQRLAIQTEADLTLTPQTVDVVQRLQYDVAYERLGQVLVWVPQETLDRCRFESSQGTNLTAIPTGLTDGNHKQHRLALESPRLGKFDLLVRYSIDRPAISAMKTPAAMSVPLVRSSDAPFTQIRVRIPSTARQVATVTGETWFSQPGSMDYSQWSQGGTATEIPLKFSTQEPGTRRGWRLLRQLVVVRYDSLDAGQCRLFCAFEGHPEQLNLRMPEGTQVIEARWNQQVLPDAPRFQASQGNGLLELKLPPPNASLPGKTNLLSLDFMLPPQPQWGGITERQVELPEFQLELPAQQTVWWMELPADQHLWQTPLGVTSEAVWQRSGWYFRRVPRRTFAEFLNWLIAAPSTTEQDIQESRGNVYAWSAQTSRTVLSFRAISRPLILLIGAGGALCCAFLLINVPALRHVLSVLAVLFLVTLLGVWYSEPVQLLLQPAVLGLGLALLAAWLQRRYRLGDPAQVVTLSSPLSVASPLAARERMLVNEAQVNVGGEGRLMTIGPGDMGGAR